MARLGRLAIAVLLAVAASAHAATARDAAQIDALLQALRAAPDDQAAGVLEGRLHDAWRHAGSPSGMMLLDRAAREIRAGSPEAAIEDADAVLVLDPGYVEAFTVRAMARLTAGDAAGALRDAAEALRREPRHIGALIVLSHAAEQRGDLTAAYGAWQKLLELDPKTSDGAARLRELHRRAVGENI